jgi:hypothetical protein
MAAFAFFAILTDNTFMENILIRPLFYSTCFTALATQLSPAIAESLQDTVVISFDHPQSIAVATDFNTSGTSTADVGETRWKITSNNAVKVNFTGTSKDDDGTTYNAPRFHKQEVDASGSLISNRYDHLETKFGLIISGADSIANEESRTNQDSIRTWKSGSNPAASPDQLTAGLSATDSPNTYWGAIMPNDSGEFTMTLHSKGVGDNSTTQSGIYSTELTAVITADEK